MIGSQGTTSGSNSSTGHFDALDGLRGIACLLVVSYHAAHDYIPGGWLGVDVFFVLSGFLITTLLLREHRTTGRVRLGAFYIRRALRLGPALLTMLLLIGGLLAIPAVRSGFESSIWLAFASTILNFNNWVQVAAPDSFGALSHAWSLSVEEQFYIIWPIVLVSMLRLGVSRARIVKLLIVVMIGLVALTALLLVILDPSQIKFAGTTRAGAMVLGSLLALRPIQVGTGPAWGAAAALGAMSLAVPANSTLLPLGGFTVVALLVTALIAHITTTTSSGIDLILNLSALRYAGRLSYGLYLYHFPALVTAFSLPGDMPGPGRAALGLAAAGVVTVASFYCIERPALRLKDRIDPRRRTAVAATDEMAAPESTRDD